jgi:hypothetical protein
MSVLAESFATEGITFNALHMAFLGYVAIDFATVEKGRGSICVAVDMPGLEADVDPMATCASATVARFGAAVDVPGAAATVAPTVTKAALDAAGARVCAVVVRTCVAVVTGDRCVSVASTATVAGVETSTRSKV